MTLAEEDLEACRIAIQHGSKSFHAASKLLPPHVRAPALALYAFCRLADDAVDLGADKAAAVIRLRTRLARAYAGDPLPTPADRAFAAMIATHDMPRALPEALLEGFAWDAEERRYDTLSDVRAYAARVAATVGAMMTVLMGVRDRDALARACDLGVAMQLTNIARDVGEDAAEGRIYLPLTWMQDEGVDVDAFLANPRPSRPLEQIVHRLLREARRLYVRAETGIALLPPRCRPAIFAARLIYAAIGHEIAKNGHDSVTRRAHTGRGAKIRLAGAALGASGLSLVVPRSATRLAPPLPETAFLVSAAAQANPGNRGIFDVDTKIANLADLFIQLEARDRGQRLS